MLERRKTEPTISSDGLLISTTLRTLDPDLTVPPPRTFPEDHSALPLDVSDFGIAFTEPLDTEEKISEIVSSPSSAQSDSSPENTHGENAPANMSHADALRNELEMLKRQLEFTKLKLKLQNFRSERDLLLKLHAKRTNELSEIEDLDQSSELRAEAAGRKLIQLLIKCQSLNGVGPTRRIREAHLQKVVDLLDKNPNVDFSFTDSFGNSALHLLCAITPSKMSIEAIKKAINMGHSPDVRTQYGKSCVHLCAETPNSHALRIVLRHGVDVTARSKSTINPSALEIALGGLKHSSSEARANTHIYAEVVERLTYESIMQGQPIEPGLLLKYGKSPAVSQAIRAARERVKRTRDATRLELRRYVKVEAIIQEILTFLMLEPIFSPLPPLNRATFQRSRSSTVRKAKVGSGTRKDPVRPRASSLLSTSTRTLVSGKRTSQRKRKSDENTDT